MIAVLALLLAAPFLAAGNVTHPTYTLDGLAFLDREHPGDADAIRYLQGIPGHHVIVEGQGSDYSYAARVSSFTGMQAVIGWTFHEFMWRNDYGPVQERMADVRAAYEDPAPNRRGDGEVRGRPALCRGPRTRDLSRLPPNLGRSSRSTTREVSRSTGARRHRR